MTPYKLILASGSPRRAELMKLAGFEFTVKLVEVDESYPPDLAPEEVAEYLAIKKAKGHESLLQKDDEMIIAADSVVIKDNVVLGKPVNKEEAVKMIRFLSEGEHKVISGVCLLTSKKIMQFSVSSTVFMTNMTAEEIDYYIDTFKPFDKAGSYGIQEWIGLTQIEKIHGSYSNIMGLPVHELYESIKNFGMDQ